MRYTGKLIGYTRKVEGTTEGTINGIDDGVNYELLDQVVEQRPEVTIHVEESKSRLFCTGMISGIFDWERSCVAGTLLVALMILDHVYGATMENGKEFVITAITTISIILAIWTLVGETFAYLCWDEGIFHRKWKCTGYGVGFVVGFMLLQGLKCYMDFLSVEGFLIVWIAYGCLRVLCAFAREIIQQLDRQSSDSSDGKNAVPTKHILADSNEATNYLITLNETGSKPYMISLFPWEYEVVKQGKEYYVSVAEITPEGPKWLMDGIHHFSIDARNITSIQPYIDQDGNEDSDSEPEDPSSLDHAGV